MRKLTLEIDKLQVETFDIDGGTEPAKGTVLGQQQWTLRCTANLHYPCNQPTNAALNANCYDSIAPPEMEGNCTNVCNSGPLACDTSIEVCG